MRFNESLMSERYNVRYLYRDMQKNVLLTDADEGAAIAFGRTTGIMRYRLQTGSPWLCWDDLSALARARIIEQMRKFCRDRRRSRIELHHVAA